MAKNRYKYRIQNDQWAENEAVELFEKAIKLSETNKYDALIEIAKKLGTYLGVFTYLKNKYKNCGLLYNILKTNLGANTFTNAKNGDINTAIAILNLKSNYGFTDRQETTLQGGENPIKVNQINLGSGVKPKE